MRNSESMGVGKFKSLFKMLAVSVLVLSAAGCANQPVGSKSRPFTMYFVPSVDSEQITLTANSVSKFLSEYISKKLHNAPTGFYVKTAVPTSYIAVIEAFGTRKADFAAVTTFSYILGRDIKKYDMPAVLAVIRGDGEKTYKAQIVAHKDAKIKSVKDLEGKSFAFVDPASTSGYVLPLKMIRDNGVKLGETVFAQKHDNVITMVYQRQVDAGATYYSTPGIEEKNGKKVEVIRDARARVKTQFPDVEDKVKIVGFTDEIPNEPWVMRADLLKDPVKNEELRNLVIEGLLEFAKTEDGKKMLQILATGTGLFKVSDKDYDGIRQVILDTAMDLENLLRKKS